MGVIEDGTGRGFQGRVNSDNRLYTFASSVPSGAVAAAGGQMWSVGTDDLNFTNDSESAILYLRYTGSQKLVIPRITYTTGASTGGSGNTVFSSIVNPTGGTIVSNATQATVFNRNFAATAGSLSGDQFKGAQGFTLTGGTEFGALNAVAAGVTFLDQNEFPIVLQSGNSFGVSVTPPTGNTSQVNRVFLICYELVVD